MQPRSNTSAPYNILIPPNLAIFHFWAKRKKLYYKNMTLRTFWTYDPKNIFGVVGTRTAHPGHIGAYCTIFNFSTKPNTFFKQIKFQTVDRHNAGQPIAHALTHGARTTARRRVKDPVPARYRSLALPPHPPSRPEKALILFYCVGQ